MKKRIGVLTAIAASLIATGVYAESEMMNIVNDGYIDITGVGAGANSVVTMEIVDKSIDLSDYDTWKDYEDAGETTVFFGTAMSDSDGKYEFNIYLPKSGAYKIRIGNEEFDEIKVSDLNYTNIEESRAALEAIKEAAKADDKDSVKSLVSEKRYAIGLQSKAFYDAALDEAAELLAEYIKDNEEDVTEENIGVICEKAMIISLLDSDEFEDFEKYDTGFGISGLKIEEFYDADFSEELAALLKDERIETIEDYDKALEECIIICLVNENDSVDNLKAALVEYADELGIDEDDITTEKCRTLMKEGIDSLDDIEAIINKKSSGSNGGGGGGGSYGGKTSSGKGNSVQSMVTTPIQNTTQKPESTQTEIFSDIEGFSWAKESINGLYGLGIISGKAPRIFAPQDNVTREEFVKMIVGSFKLSVIGEDLPFTDVDKDAWYAKYIECAYYSKIVNGYSETIFGTGDCITRQDVAVMVANAAKACDYKFKETGTEVSFVDEAQIADYAKDAVKTLVKAGIISGNQNGEFNPRGYATRAEAAKILYMTIQNTEK